MSTNKFKIVTIEGNIGSGKSTLLKLLKEFIKINKLHDKIIFLKEPVSEWENIRDTDGNTMLQKFYMDPEKYSFSFQMMAYISRLSCFKEAVEKFPDAIIITERCLYTDKEVFAKMLYDTNKIEDVNYQIYLKWFDVFAKDYPISKMIYVNTAPEICLERINKRNRNGENSIPLEYLKNCHEYHNEMIDKYKDYDQLILNGNINIDEKQEQIIKWIDEILEFIY